MLRRQVFWAATAAWAVMVMGCSKLEAPTHITIGMEQIQGALQTRFPQRFPVAGLLLLEMQQPQLQPLPESNQLGAKLLVQLSGSALPHPFQGQMDVRFGLRYDAASHTVLSERVAVDSLSLDGAGAAIADMVSTYGARLAEQALDSIALHTLSASDLEMLKTMKVQPGAITITPQGLSIAIDRQEAA